MVNFSIIPWLKMFYNFKSFRLPLPLDVRKHGKNLQFRFTTFLKSHFKNLFTFIFEPDIFLHLQTFISLKLSPSLLSRVQFCTAFLSPLPIHPLFSSWTSFKYRPLDIIGSNLVRIAQLFLLPSYIFKRICTECCMVWYHLNKCRYSSSP